MKIVEEDEISVNDRIEEGCNEEAGVEADFTFNIAIVSAEHLLEIVRNA